MNQLITSNQPLTMSSREIAEYTNKEHKNVTVDIRKMLDELDLDTLEFQRIYKDSMNRSQVEYVLDRDLTDCLLTGYSAKARMSVIKRWKELELNVHAPQLPDFNNPAAAARAWADEVEQKAIVQEQLKLAAPKVEFVDRYVNCTGNKGFRQVCKLLNAKEGEFREFLLDSKIMYRLGREWVAYSNHIEAGRFTTYTGEGNGHAYNTAMFTPKGVQWVAGLWIARSI